MTEQPTSSSPFVVLNPRVKSKPNIFFIADQGIGISQLPPVELEGIREELTRGAAIRDVINRLLPRLQWIAPETIRKVEIDLNKYWLQVTHRPSALTIEYKNITFPDQGSLLMFFERLHHSLGEGWSKKLRPLGVVEAAAPGCFVLMLSFIFSLVLFFAGMERRAGKNPPDGNQSRAQRILSSLLSETHPVLWLVIGALCCLACIVWIVAWVKKRPMRGYLQRGK